MESMRQFELLEDLVPGGSASAVLVRWNGKGYMRGHEEVVLHDFIGGHGNRGDRGYAFQSPESGRWEVVSGLFEQPAPWLP